MSRVLSALARMRPGPISGWAQDAGILKANNGPRWLIALERHLKHFQHNHESKQIDFVSLRNEIDTRVEHAA